MLRTKRLRRSKAAGEAVRASEIVARHARLKLGASVACEGLEQRLLFSTVTWISSSSGSWDVASNWSGGAVPASGDAVVINQPGVTVTINNNESITSLTCADNLTIAAGSLNITANSQINGTFTIGGNGVGLGGATLAVTSATEWDSGTVSGGTLANTGALTLGSSADKFLNGSALNNSGTMTQLLGRILLTGATINNLSGSLYDDQTDNTIYSYGGTNAFNNSGTLRKSVGTGTFSVGVPFYNASGGQILVQTGTIVPTGGGTDTGGTFNVAANALLDLTGGSSNTFSGTYTGSGAGIVQLSGGTLNISGGAVFNFPANYFQWNGGTIAGGTLTNTNIITLSGTGDKFLNNATLDNKSDVVHSVGRILLTNATILNESTGLYDFQNTADVVLYNYGGNNAFNNLGTVRKSTGAGNAFIQFAFNNDAAGIIDIHAASVVLQGGGTSNGGTFTLSNGASIDLTGGTQNNLSGTYTSSGQGTVQLNSSTLNVGTAGATFNFPTGMFQWTGGTITGAGGLQNNAFITLAGTNDKFLNACTLTNGGTITQMLGRILLTNATIINPSGELYDVQTDNTIYNYGGTNAFENSGTFRRSAGTNTFTIGVPFNNAAGGQIVVQTGVFELTGGGTDSGGTFNVAANAVFDVTGGQTNTFTGTYTGTGAGVLQLSSGTLNIPGGAVFNFPSNYFQWTGGTIAGGTLTNSNVITLNGTNDKFLNAATLNNNGTVTQFLGRLLLTNATVNNAPNALYDVQTDNTIYNYGGTNAFNNSGTLRKSAGGGVFSIGTPFYNAVGGQIVGQTGTFSLAGGGLSSGGIFTVSSGTVLDLTGGNANQFNGTYTGSGLGSIQFNSGILNVTGGATFNLPGNLFQWTGGTIAGGTLTNAGVLTLSGTNDKFLNTATIDNTGSVIQLLGRILLTSATLTNEAGALYDFQTDNVIYNYGGTNAFNNAGTVRKSVGTGTSQIQVNLTNTGTLEVDTGTVNVAGTLSEDPAATITTRIFNQGAGQLSIGSAVALAGKLNIILPAGFVPVQGNMYNVVTYPSQTGSFSSINGLSASGVALTANTGTTAETITVGTGAPAPQVDLTLSGVTYTAAMYQTGSTLTVTGTESNSGPGPAGPYDVSVVLSPDQVFGNANDIVLATIHESGLAGGMQKPFSASSAIPASTPAGNYYVLAQIDSGQVINETSFSNELFVSGSPNIVVVSPPPAPPAPPPPGPPPPPSTIGGLDPTFGINGLASHDVGFTSTSGVAVQSDGKSVIAGTTGTAGSQEFGLTRYNADGSLDTTFGTNGVVTTSFGGDDQSAAVAVLPDGDILVAGTDTTANGSEFALAEYTSAGALDTTFGSGTGMVLTSFSTTAGTLSNDIAHAMVVAANGTIYLGGSSDAAAKGEDFAIAAYNADGSIDTHFGGGTVLKDFSGGDDVIYGLAVQTNGDVVAAGSTANPSTGIAAVGLARFLPTGAIDKTFASKGQVVTTVRGVADVASSVAIDHLGKIVIGGLSATGSPSDGSLSSDFLVIRYTASGAVDRTFGKGPVITSFGQPSALSKVLIEGNGDIVASGKSVATLTGLDPSQLQIAIARYTANGALDTTFNTTGTALFSLSGVTTAAAATPAISHATFSAATVTFGLKPFSTAAIALAPQDSTGTLLQEFQQFEQSAQGVVAVTQGGELLDVGNSGVNTVEAAIVASGIDLAAQLIATLPPAVVGGAKGFATVRITESGTDAATGTITIQLFASPDPAVDSGLSPFQSFPERVNLRSGQGASFRLHYALPTSLSNGNYYLVSYVDTGSVRDLSLANNAAASTSAVDIAAPFVDLAGNGLAPVGLLKAGKLATVMFNVMNDGNVPAKGNIAVQILASVDGKVSDGILLGTPGLSLLLNPNATRRVREVVRLPASLAVGSYFLVAVLDSGNVLNDPNLTNNVLVSTAMVAVT